MSADFSAYRLEGSGMLYSKCWNRKASNQEYTARLEGDIKNFRDRHKLKEFTTTKQDLQEMLKGLL